MNSKEIIFNKLRQHSGEPLPKPSRQFEAISYPNKVERFKEVLSAVGGAAIELSEGADLGELIRSLYPEAKRIGTALTHLGLESYHPDELKNPSELNGTDLGIIEGKLGVCENGCVWVDQEIRQRALFFISESIVIILDKSKLVQNMHEAYRLVAEIDSQSPYSCFISGPSKTADIEQALVIGAHGPKGATVILV